MLSEKMQAALNQQVNAELYSAYMYLSMSAYFESANLPGFAHWLQIQAEEEVDHATRICSHIYDRMGRVTLTAIAGPPTDWASPLAAFEAVLQHEQKVTGMINDLLAVANGEHDAETAAFLQWFVSEQVEEEASADAVVQKLKQAGDSPEELSARDAEMGKRRG